MKRSRHLLATTYAFDGRLLAISERSRNQPFDLRRKSEEHKRRAFVEIIFAGIVYHSNEALSFRVRVRQHLINFPDFKRGATTLVIQA